MNAPAVDIASLLAAEGSLSLTIGTNLHVGIMPDASDDIPNDCVAVFDTGGPQPQLTLKKGENYYYPSVQIRVRNTDYRTGWALIQDVLTTLHGVGPQTVGGTLYTVIRAASNPAFLEWDENNRCIFICNFNTQRR